MTNNQEKFRVVLKKYQDNFLFSTVRFPALFSGWGTGKSMCGILKIMKLAEDYPGNRLVIFRKEFTDLAKSTMKDFTLYTGIPVSEHKKEVVLPNKSEIFFLHMKELDILKNMNIGGYLLEQAEELETSEQFDYLDGRLRLKAAGLRQGIVIANTTEETHWIYRYWKENPTKDNRFQYWEANSFENEDNLPADTIESWRLMEARNPAVYKRFIANKWGIGDDQFILIPSQSIEALKDITLTTQVGKKPKRLIACDPSLGGDECVAHAIDDGKIIDTEIYHDKDLMILVGHLLLLGAKHKIDDYAIDCIGLGQGIASRLNELGKRVQYIGSAEKSADITCYNRRAEMWWYVSQEIHRKRIPYPEDPELRRQLSSVRYKVLNSDGLIQLEPKETTKKRLGNSPDRADAFVYGIWGLQNVKPPPVTTETYRDKHKQDGTGNYMSV
ncbi:MAG: phage terminase large subunit [Dehalococcoidales bacterium]|nr:phage terminase large subunit [Dehalococcoidales bacterium]